MVIDILNIANVIPFNRALLKIMQKMMNKYIKIKYENILAYNNALNFASLVFLCNVECKNLYITMKYKLKKFIT